MSELATPEVERSRIGRRTLIKRAAATGAIAWTAPMILDSLASPAAAVSPPPTPGCKSVQITAGDCTTSVTPTFGPAACNPGAGFWKHSGFCPDFAGGQNLAGTLCITSPACTTTTSPIIFNIGTDCNCTFTDGFGESNAGGPEHCVAGALTPGNKTITFTLLPTGTPPATAWLAFRFRVTCT
jgi:hypothetical protein